jgi:uncharacterized Tic20 family protein
MQPSVELTEGSATAVAAESLYLANLLILPGIGFLILLAIWWRAREQSPPLASSHLAQTVSGSIWAGILLVVANGLILLLGGYDGPNVWVVVITYFTLCHSILVMFGAFGLAKAMAGQCWRYPLVGRPLPSGCGQGD